MKSILVPTDFSDQAGYALDLAKKLAIKYKAAIQLIHIVEQPGSHYLTAHGGSMQHQLDNVYVLQLIKKVKAQLKVVVNNLEKAGVKASYEIKIGNPFKHISSQIKSEGHDLIVMGTLGISGLNEVLVGSNTEKVIRHANCPVIALKGPVKPDLVKDIVFAVNYFERNDYLASQIKMVQKLFAANAHLVTINTPNNFLIERQVIGALQEFVAQHNITDCTLDIYSDITEEEGIVHFAEDRKAHAVAMATHGRTGIGHLLAGSLSEDMVNHSKLPVITFPIRDQQMNKSAAKQEQAESHNE